MKNIIKTLAATLFLAASIGAAASGPAPAAAPSSPEFERLKTLVGTWEGKADLGQGPVDMIVKFRLLAGGTVLEERIFPGTPHEMITMYFEKEGRLALTHYCVMGNRPGMLLKSADADTLRFDFDKTCGIDPLKETHMNSMTLRFDSPNSITTTCGLVINGEPQPEHETTLKRVQS